MSDERPDQSQEPGSGTPHDLGPGTPHDAGPDAGPDAGDTQRLPQPQPAAPPYQQPYQPVGDRPYGGEGAGRRSGRPRNGMVAAILVAALVIGGLAGVGGAAAFGLVDGGGDNGSGSSASSPVRSSPVVNRSGSTPGSQSVEAVAAAVLPSVVKINVSNSQEAGSGSGIIISSDGEILTNNHVASVAGRNGRISVSFNDGTAKRAHIVGTDPVTDLAVIKAEGVSGLQPARIGISKQVEVGEQVVAIGSPFGLEATVTSGIVSALNRPVSVQTSESQPSPNDPFGFAPQQTPSSTIYPAIQTDAAINPGNSGGPLVDLSGDVIGINSSIRTASSGLDSSQGGSIGLGFAIPMNKVWPVVQQLRKGQTPTHAKMGIAVTDATSNNGLLTGAGVAKVNSGSAAEKAGLKKGDVITKVDDDTISGADSLVATVRGHRPGDKVTLTVVSNGDHRHTVQVTLGSDKGSASS
jgi:putative serine protease PepD